MTPSGVRFVRTPDACFDDLPNWDFEPRYVEIDGLRQGFVESGPADGEVILLLHGQPSWSYLYRFMITPLASAGYRVIAMDHVGFGLSDKPVDVEYHSFSNHANRLVSFMDALELDVVTLFAQDWGSIIGLYVAAGDLERFERIVIGNGGLPVVTAPTAFPDDIESATSEFARFLSMVPDEQPPFFDEEGNSLLPSGGSDSDLFGAWMAYALHDEDFRPSRLLDVLTYRALEPDEERAYDAPYPHRIAMAGPRTFPSLRNDLVGITEARIAMLRTYERPFLTLFGGNDPGLAGEGDGQQWMIDNVPGAAGQPHHRFPDASHFLQEDRGPDLAERIRAFIEANP